jgi:cystathionine gamma-synthase
MSPNADSHSQSTLCVHADDPLNTLPASADGEITDVAPALHVSTTYRFNKDPEKLVEAKDCDVSRASGIVDA